MNQSFNNGPSSKNAALERGRQAEQQAEAYLIRQGLKLICRNFRCRYGELDLVMLDRQTLVIVEVRLRRNSRYGSALESITLNKQALIIAATQVYLANQALDRAVRFDVVTFDEQGKLHWLANAF